MRKPLFIARQGRRPSGLLGLLVANIMAKETAAENEAALEFLGLGPQDSLLEIGSGHGDTLARAVARTRGRLCGVDFSPVMHGRATRRHRRLVREGVLEFHLAASDRLPLPDGAFDRALSVHTIYFWSEPLEHLREARRVLRPGGRLVLGFRPAEDPGFEATFPAAVYFIRPEAEVADLVSRAGFRVAELARRAFGDKRMSFALAEAA